ncbi:hypothetical protein ACBJ59_52210 [Nonomuraea sp. MTCD27]|uniref:hypothetical protein n=1 Tax=Nonomuraea sp. MTCD27 TaxID=1676747 RepID=UPI0035C0BC47
MVALQPVPARPPAKRWLQRFDQGAQPDHARYVRRRYGQPAAKRLGRIALEG